MMSFNVVAAWRNEAAFDDLLIRYRQEADRLMLGMCAFLQCVCFALAPIHNTWGAAFGIGFFTLFTAWLLVNKRQGALTTRLFMGCAFMAYTALIIDQTASTEGHFSAFGLIGCLLFYRDWRTIIAATLFIYLHHLILGYAQVAGLPVFVFETTAYWHNFLTHVLYFLPFAVMMSYLSIALRRQGVDAEHVRRLSIAVISGDINHPLDTRSMNTENELLSVVGAMRNRLMQLIQLMPVAVAVIRTDTKTVVTANQRWLSLFQISEAEHLNQHVAQLPIWTTADQWLYIDNYFANANTHTLETHELILKRNNNALFRASVSIMLEREGTPQRLIVAIEDITKRHQAEMTLHKLAYEDMLSGLANRSSLHDDIAKRFQKLQQTQIPFALLLLDLDGFKHINDTHGHDAGDEVLQVVSQRLQRLRRDCDMVARLGGDEFCIVLDNCNQTGEAGYIATRILNSISHPIQLTNGIVCQVGGSVGISLSTSGASNVSELLKLADLGLYQAKHAGKACWRIYQPTAST